MPALTTYTTPVLADWVDYNGHLRDAFYLLIFSYATDALMDTLGLDSENREASGHSLFTLELHLNYLHEVKLGAEVEVHTQLIAHDAKRLHLYHSLHLVGDEKEFGRQRTDAAARRPGGSAFGPVCRGDVGETHCDQR